MLADWLKYRDRSTIYRVTPACVKVKLSTRIVNCKVHKKLTDNVQQETGVADDENNHAQRMDNCCAEKKPKSKEIGKILLKFDQRRTTLICVLSTIMYATKYK